MSFPQEEERPVDGTRTLGRSDDEDAICPACRRPVTAQQPSLTMHTLRFHRACAGYRATTGRAPRG